MFLLVSKDTLKWNIKTLAVHLTEASRSTYLAIDFALTL